MAPKGTKKRVARRSKKVARKAPKKKTTKKKVGKKVAPKKAVKAAKPKALITSAVQPKGSYLSKTELLNNFCFEAQLTKKEGKACFEALTSIGQGELAKRGKFVIPGMARFVVKKKAATKARQGINPFTKEPCVFKAKPARKIVKAYIPKAFKDL